MYILIFYENIDIYNLNIVEFVMSAAIRRYIAER
jgi:hypothetical protein